MWTVNSQRQPADNQSNCEDVSAHQRSTDCVDANSVALLNSVQNPIDGQTHQNPSLEHQIASLDSNNLESSVTEMQQEGRSSSATTTANVLATRTAGVDTVVSCDIADGADVKTIVVVDDDDDDTSSEANPVTKKSSWTAAYKAKIAAEINNELAHPDDVFITAAQYKLDEECAEFAARAHAEDKTVELQIANTIFYLSSFHFKEDNHSMRLYTDPSPSLRRQEWVDFVRRRNDDYVLHLWDQRIAVMLTLKSSETNTYQPRFFVAMTNLYMQLGGGKVHKELVLLDILVRMDIHSYVDALVGVIATGEVSLWKHSKDHLRFLHCDFMNEVERGENFWIARRKRYYEDKGLICLPQRLIPRDLDAPRSRFAMSKEFITNYKHGYTTEAEFQANFDKWTILPGRFKSFKELADSTNKKERKESNAAAERARNDEQAKKDAAKKRNDEINERRQATRRKNIEEKKKADEQKLLNKYVEDKRRTAAPPPPSHYGASLPHHPLYPAHRPVHLPPPPAQKKITTSKSSSHQKPCKHPVEELTYSSSLTAENTSNQKKEGPPLSRRHHQGNYCRRVFRHVELN